MKAFNKRVNRKKASKVTLKTHRKHNHRGLVDEKQGFVEDAAVVRPEDVRVHQHY